MNLAAIIEDHPAERSALVDRGATITYGQLRERVADLRAGLSGLGLEPGDRVAIIRDNDTGFVTSYLAILGAGLVAVPLNPQSPDRELARELAAVGARAVVAGATPDGDPSWRSAVDHVVTPDELVAQADGRAPAAIVDRADADLAVLLFTTGTAGPPKAAKLTHGSLKANIDQLLAHPGSVQTADDVVLGVLPLFHIFGLNVMLGLTLATGATLVLVDRFEPQAAVDTMAEHGITLLSGPPTLFAALTRLPESETSARAFAAVRLTASGAAPLSAEVADAFQARFGLRLHQGYGLTEASPAVTTTVGLDAPVESIGVPLPGVEVRVVDVDGENVLAGDGGEIRVRGPNVFAGYWDDDEATRTVLTTDGWLRTGDLGVTDDDGLLYIVDRAKDLIIVSGFNVHPAEVEEVVMEHPAVQEAAAVGVPDNATGEAVKVFVVLAPDADAAVDEAELIRFCESHLARYKCPDAVELVDQIPRGFAGKLLRRSLR
ncbi:MAG: AMP-binding protein [Acidimicrobiales bacterium]